MVAELLQLFNTPSALSLPRLHFHAPLQNGCDYGVRLNSWGLLQRMVAGDFRGAHWCFVAGVGARSRGTRNGACCRALASPELYGGSYNIDDAVRKIREAVGVQDIAAHEHFFVSGTQTLLGMEGHWRLIWSNDGKFFEQFDGSEMSLEWAYDRDHEPWAVDAAGRVSNLNFDDREVCLLTSWIRTGYWVTKKGQQQLLIQLEEGGLTSIEEASSSELVISLGASAQKLKMSVNKKQYVSEVVAYVSIGNKSWLPLHTRIKAFGGWGNWEYFDWQPLLLGKRVLFPFSAVHTPSSGNKELYSLREFKVVSDGVRDNGARHSFYSRPNCLVVPRAQQKYPRTHIDSTILPSVQMIRAESGQHLVRPLIDGRDIGYFILDTGASSLTIVPEKAKELGLYSFGEVHVTGAAGEVTTQYCRAKSFQLGPLTVEDPLFMEVPVGSLVRGVSPVAGICGYDVFYHCIVEMACRKGTLSLFDPSACRPTYSEALNWHPLHLIENVPHVSATFNGITAMFLLDTGAGGVDVIFHGRAVEDFDLLTTIQPDTIAHVIGLTTSGGGLQVQLGILDTLEVAGQSFRQVKALLGDKNTYTLDTSDYVTGILCGDLLSEYCVLFDYTQQRVAFVDIDINNKRLR